MWEFKECRDAIKKTLWSYNRAQDGEREYKQNTLRNPKRDGDILADIDANIENKKPIFERDERRYLITGKYYIRGFLGGFSSSGNNFDEEKFEKICIGKYVNREIFIRRKFLFFSF